ncbi:AAA family ATPase [Thermotoga sp. KOL6]|uniref:AAA family ATPase n=1 Tax=Thermotoga sp. KOL6 TaxID=126741 RepID=UPI000C7902B3|nr:SMC family ATPase [Thermotoga sp. KOL6]PLV60288.1 DNA repair protein Rad50 [Thermotoga sp. KOL6]
MKPEKLIAKNFLGLKEVNIDFEEGITVIEGPNGAGKSSIFEAITFALFGVGIRYGSNVYDYVNTTSGNGKAYLVFQFERGGKKYEIVREIDAGRNKHSAVLIEILENGKKAKHSGRVSEVKKKIEEILGVSHRTFIKTIFLPQGRIDELLKSTPGEISEIVSDVFQDKEVLEKLKKLLDRKMKDLNQEIAGQESLYRRFSDFLDENKLDVLKEKLTTILQKREKLRKEERELREKEKNLSFLVEIYQELMNKKEKLKKLLERKKTLEKELEIEKRIKKAKEIEPLFRELSIEEERIKKLSEDIEKYKKRLEHLVREKVETEKKVKESTHILSILTEQINELNKEVKTCEEVLEASQPLLEKKIRISENLKQNEQALERLQKEKEMKEKNLISLESDMRKTKEKLQIVEEKLSELRKDRLSWLAYQVASQLEDGDICPVCGGEFHGEVKVIEFDNDLFEKLEEKKKVIENELLSLEEKVRNQNEILENLQREINEKKHILQTLKEEKMKIEEKLESIGYKDGIERDLREKRKQLENLERKKQGISEIIVSEKSKLSQLERQIDDTKNEIETKTKDLEGLKSNFENIQRAFLKELESAKISPNEFETLVKEKPREVEKELTKIETEIQLLSESVATLEREEVKDVREEYEETKKQLDNIASELSKLGVEEGRLRKIIEEVLEKEKEIERIEKNIRELRKKYENLELLKELLFDKRKFPAFFTERVLDTVLKRANSYLEILTEGRFGVDFVSGKGFVIYDRGVERPASGLSGGESSLIAISLAMSLAEVASGRLDAFFIDEGFSSLDTGNKAKVASVLKELEKLNKVIVFITHDKEFSESFDRKLKISEGVVISNG